MGLPPNSLPATSPLTTTKVRSVRPNSVDGICADLESPSRPYEVCLDMATDQISSQHFGGKSGPVEDLYDDFVNFGAARYARHRLIRQAGAMLEANVVTLDAVDRFATDVFLPPSGTTAKDWCPNPSFEKNARSSGLSLGGPTEILTRQGGPWFYYVLVGSDGHVDKTVQLYPDGRMIDRALAGSLLPERFPVQMCAGKAIEYERILQISPSSP